MGTTDWTTRAYDGRFAVAPKDLDNRVQIMERYFDASSVGMTAAEVYNVMTVADNMMVLNVYTVVETAEGDAGSLDIGDDGDATRYETDADLNAAGVTKSADVNHIYTAAGTIDITPSITLDTAKFWVVIEFVNLAEDLG